MDPKNRYIYRDLFPVLWKSVANALRLCIDYHSKGDFDKIDSANPELIDCFPLFSGSGPKGWDKHLLEGHFVSHRKRKGLYPRALKLTVHAFEEARRIKVRSSKIVIPSPLQILYHLFIVPEHSFTAAYSLWACRSFLFELLQMRPEVPSAAYDIDGSSGIRLFSESQVMASLADFDHFEAINDRWPKEDIPPRRDGTNSELLKGEISLFLGHFLAMKGIANLWLKSKSDAIKFLSFNKDLDFDEFLLELRRKIYSAKFRRSARYHELPESGEVLNQVFGTPVPIKGAEIVFFGGLKPAANGGLVISVSGRAGVGKTSFALAFANSFSPFGTLTYYISLEEGIEDIKKRLLSIKPQEEKDLSYFTSTDHSKWFFGHKYSQAQTLTNFTAEIAAVATELKPLRDAANRKSAKFNRPVCPYIVIIDNINELLANPETFNYKEIEEFIETCRRLGAIVLLISAEGIPEKLKIEYLIDVGIELKHKDIGEENAKPVRIFDLFKTRHQLSRQGAHVFHMSGPGGFRISPQIPSQMDRKERVERNLYDESKLIHTLNFLNDDLHSTDETLRVVNQKRGHPLPERDNRKLYIRLFPRTHILVHGFGSAGKAGFGLKLLLTPPVDAAVPLDQLKFQSFDKGNSRRKVLVISFLYSEKYYDELLKSKMKFRRYLNNLYPGAIDPDIQYLVLYPGYLSPQDFLNKVTRKLDEGDLKGEPFTGVLVDGLHNVFLQFEKLQNSNMVWPMLYNILSRYPLTVVSTFTNFSLNDKLIDDELSDKNKIVNQAVPDYLLLQQGMAPFLHALVKAADYYFFTEQHTDADGTKRYLMAVKSATGQTVPEELLEWDRERNVFKNIYTVKMIRQLEDPTGHEGLV